jgi:hypothetical protein
MIDADPRALFGTVGRQSSGVAASPRCGVADASYKLTSQHMPIVDELMCSHEPDAADSLLVPLHVGDRLPWKLDRHGQRGMVTTCGSACHALPARRVADRADLRHRLRRGQVLSRIRGGRTPGVQRR